MPKYSIAFVTPDDKNMLLHKIIDAADRNAALKEFFDNEILNYYSKDVIGYTCFIEDFFDKSTKQGSIIYCSS